MSETLEQKIKNIVKMAEEKYGKIEQGEIGLVVVDNKPFLITQEMKITNIDIVGVNPKEVVEFMLDNSFLLKDTSYVIVHYAAVEFELQTGISPFENDCGFVLKWEEKYYYCSFKSKKYNCKALKFAEW